MAKDWHAQGQQDYEKKRGYNPPHGTLEELFTWGKRASEKRVEENNAYRDGWRNAKKNDKSR